MSAKNITKLQKEEDFAKFLENNQMYLVVVFFSAEWSEESKVMAEVVGEMVKSEETSRTTRFIQLEAEEFEEISLKYNVEAVPTFVLLRVRLKMNLAFYFVLNFKLKHS